MKPDISRHNPDPAYLRRLIADSGLTIRKAASVIGVNERLMRMYLADRNSKSAQNAPYAVQYALEQLTNEPCSKKTVSKRPK